jgi:transposase
VIALAGGVRVMVATRPVDFRKGAEGLAALVRARTARQWASSSRFSPSDSFFAA